MLKQQANSALAWLRELAHLIDVDDPVLCGCTDSIVSPECAGTETATATA
jgi:hypothetical protein